MSADQSEQTYLPASDDGASPQSDDCLPRQNEQLPFSQLDDYEIVRKLGSGGMGDVFLGRQSSLDRLVAIKTLRPELSSNPVLVSRFQREARSMAQLDHPNIVRCYHFGNAEGIHYLAIEYIAGESLRQLLSREKQLSLDNTLCIARTSAQALLSAHEQEMIHRDIKPDNILISQNGQIKISDFGLAKALDDNLELTQSGMGMGTPLYMPLEQIQNAKRVDQRADIYALGATLYHCLAGLPPFSQSTLVDLIEAKQKGSYPSIRKQVPNLPERMEWILDKMLAREPQHRYQSLVEFLRDLEPLGPGAVRLQLAETKTGTTNSARSTNDSALQFSIPADSLATRPLTDAVVSPELEKTTPLPEPSLWQVVYTNEQGASEFLTLAQEDLEQRVRRRLIPLTAEAKPKAASGFRKLIHYPQFQDLGTLVDTLNFAAVDVTKKKAETEAIRKQAEIPPIYQQTWFYVTALSCFVAALVWISWPLSNEEKFQRGEKMFASGQLADQISAVEQYFRPLVADDPDSDLAMLSQEKIDEFDAMLARKRLEKKLFRGSPPESEPERLYFEATHLKQFGDNELAMQTLTNLVEHFQKEKQFSSLLLIAGEDLKNVEQLSAPPKTSREFLHTKLIEAETNWEQGQQLAAQEIWRTIFELYALHPHAAEIVEYASTKLRNQPTEKTLEELFSDIIVPADSTTSEPPAEPEKKGSADEPSPDNKVQETDSAAQKSDQPAPAARDSSSEPDSSEPNSEEQNSVEQNPATN